MNKGKLSAIGFIGFIIGIAGIESAINGEGSFLVSVIVFGIGLACSAISLRGEA